MNNNENVLGTTDFEEFLDKEIVIMLWDGRQIYGILRSFDQYNSITIQNTREIYIHEKLYSEKDIGLVIVRGENIILLGTYKGFLNNFNKMDYLKFCEMTSAIKS
ncbi:Sm-like protein [Hamiltosporidium tvaerminnensis]|uniref:U6 snRNA-associated Sm-like protein LSm1 n=2 Tax=Hamiltosporidium TaxID=1176354 RepID=A0A4Q9L884_9MICR|nr:SM-like, degradation of cytoplasmic mRNAs and positively regulates transcription initiation [Hamiltosporidium tvaerminnensis]TBU03794.1 Sm-like protein [Hamiltosporidium magnivora]TBU08798.1 Sm-like protein [Hamiltosporidium magnivora]TBU13545.1 Sm-like protein [Hamiltosporidium tvaerminnensis]